MTKRAKQQRRLCLHCAGVEGLGKARAGQEEEEEQRQDLVQGR